jgi:hypothetical protein
MALALQRKRRPQSLDGWTKRQIGQSGHKADLQRLAVLLGWRPYWSRMLQEHAIEVNDVD